MRMLQRFNLIDVSSEDPAHFRLLLQSTEAFVSSGINLSNAPIREYPCPMHVLGLQINYHQVKELKSRPDCSSSAKNLPTKTWINRYSSSVR